MHKTKGYKIICPACMQEFYSSQMHIYVRKNRKGEMIPFEIPLCSIACFRELVGDVYRTEEEIETLA